MTDSKLLDSSTWLEYFHNKKNTNLIESDAQLLSSTLSIFEIKKKLEKDNQKKEFVTECLNFLKERSIVIPLDTKIAENAAELSLKYKLAALDSLIYATATMHKAILISMDNDFRNLPDVQILS